MQTYTNELEGFKFCTMNILSTTTTSPYDSEYKDHFYQLCDQLYIDSDGDLQVYIED